MNRRSFLQSGTLALSAMIGRAPLASATLARMKITRIRYYEPPTPPSRIFSRFNQNSNIVTIETDQGLTGIGEGGSKETIEQCAAMLIGEDPTNIEHLWQYMFRGYFYPAGREKLHAIGALDVALWDLKGKALGVPVNQLLGGLSREYLESYVMFPRKNTLKETARACIEAGFRAYRTATAEPGKLPFNSQDVVQQTYQQCQEIREGVGKDGAWAIDYHTRLDLSDAVRLSTLIEPLGPYFVEDPLRSENPGVYRALRGQVKVPIAAGEFFGARWDINELIEQHLIDYARVSIPNVGGLTEYMKIATLCETHYVGLIPHFSGPISEAALVHACSAFSGPVLMEMNNASMVGTGPREVPYLPELYDFRNGKFWPNSRPGLGVAFDPKHVRMIAEVTEHSAPGALFRRPDGSMTNW